LLSESLTLSLLPVLLILGHEFLRSHNPRYLTAMVLTACLLATVKDVGAYFSLSFGAFVFLVTLMRLISWRRGLLYVSVLVAIFGFALFSAEASQGPGMQKRWVFPLLNNIGQRILVDPDRTEEFRIRGMPVDEALLRQRGMFASANDWAMYNDPQLEAFRTWLVAEGRRVYGQSLVRHPRRTIRDTWRGLQDVNTNYLAYMRPYQPPGPLNAGFTEALARPSARMYRGALILAGLLSSIVIRRRRGPAIRLLVLHLSLGLPIIVAAVVSVNGDAMELWRHTSFVFVLARLWLLLFLFALINFMSEGVGARSHEPVAGN
jgi:hypothetical protein